MARIRTNIELEERYVTAIMDRLGVHTKTAAVDLALRHLAGAPMTREEALSMRGAHAIGEVPRDVGPTTAARSSSTRRRGSSTTERLTARSTAGSGS